MSTANLGRPVITDDKIKADRVWLRSRLQGFGLGYHGVILHALRCTAQAGLISVAVNR
jgi:hypothetical protein